MALKFYSSVAKRLKLKVRKFLGLMAATAEFTGVKLVGAFLPPPILNRVKIRIFTVLLGFLGIGF